MQNTDEWITTSQAARRLGIAASTVRTYAIEGRLPHLTLPSGHRRFRAADVDAFQASMSGPEGEAA